MPNKTLTDSKKIDVLKFISKTHRKIHEGRIKRELHVVITALSFYAACVAFKLREGFSGGHPFSIFACVAFIIIGIYVFIYMESSGRSNNINQKIAHEAEILLCLTYLNRELIIKEVEDNDSLENRLSFRAINVLANLLRVNLLGEPDNRDDNRWQKKAINAIIIFVGIDVNRGEYQPSRNRWLWQAIIVLLGAILSILIINYWIIVIIISCVILIWCFERTVGRGSRRASRL
jgi:hypothetical protein